MNDILKQRLVGALILVALGVVFWPIIFVEPHEKNTLEQQPIPPPPDVSTTPIETPHVGGLRGSSEPAVAGDSALEETPVANGTPVSALSDKMSSASPSPPAPAATSAQSAAKSATPTTPAVRSEAPQRLAIDAAGVPVAWTLQVATVSSPEKAENLRQQLLAMKQKVYVATLHAGGKTLYRVCIGPKFERVELEKLQTGINAKFGVTSIVARYLP